MASSPRGEETVEDFGESVAIDTALIAAAQAVEHYEMARYGALMRGPLSSTCREPRPAERKSARGEEGGKAPDPNRGEQGR
jgi:hypothetical protein